MSDRGSPIELLKITLSEMQNFLLKLTPVSVPMMKNKLRDLQSCAVISCY